MSRDQFSQLMLVYTGMAADIAEIFEAFRESKVTNTTTKKDSNYLHRCFYPSGYGKLSSDVCHPCSLELKSNTVLSFYWSNT